ncbi:MAG: histidinol-phosphatase [Ruminococcus sp.]|nr:histidinol-phosphatase HisJ family protein [Oscillospiraceae bacterium]MBR2724206.1 histidinol-phosphatase [Ruminococcus sp.]
MIKRDYHIHTNLCDGKDSPEEIVLSAIEKGFSTIGFSGHSPLYSEYWCMTKENLAIYKKEITRLKEKYKDKIEILLGLEQDYYSEPLCKSDYDYVIGSVHGIKVSDGFVFMDDTVASLKQGIEKHFGGDSLLLAEEYYSLVADVKNKTDADIIGHFDLLLKFQEDEQLFDTGHPRYIKAAKRAIDKLAKENVLFEVNTGAISRGYRTTPYPEAQMLRYINEKGCDVILTSDCHNRNNLGFAFESTVNLIKECGFKRIAYLTNGKTEYISI